MARPLVERSTFRSAKRLGASDRGRMKCVDEQGEGTSPTLAALRAPYREHRAAGRAAASRPTQPLDFAPAALQPLIRREPPGAPEQGRGGLPTHFASSIFVFSLVRDRLFRSTVLAGNWKTSRMVAHYSAGATAERGAVARYL